MLIPRCQRVLTYLGVLLTILCSLGISLAHAETATLMHGSLSLSEPGESPGLFANTSYEFDIPDELQKALRRGIALYFVHEIRVNKNRWYWLDRKVLDSKTILRLSFNPITRRYRVVTNGLSFEYDSLNQALPFIKNLHHWRISDYNPIGNPQKYTVESRFYLDNTKLPKPMQVTSTSSDDWSISSDWSELPIPTHFSNED